MNTQACINIELSWFWCLRINKVTSYKRRSLNDSIISEILIELKFQIFIALFLCRSNLNTTVYLIERLFLQDLPKVLHYLDLFASMETHSWK